MGQSIFVHLGCLPVALILMVSGCNTSNVLSPALDPNVYYERDMIVTVNGATREGSIAMPLLPVNKIHVYAPGSLDIFLMKNCGGTFKKTKAWNIKKDVPSGLFGWGTRTIDVKNETEFTIQATDFQETGVCPLYLTGIDKTTGQNSDAFVAWQTPQYQLRGRMVCNMEVRFFAGVEACSTSSGSYTKLSFDEEVFTSPSPGCPLPSNTGRVFEFRTKSGSCNYRFEGKKTGKVGVYHVYGFDKIIVR